MRKFIKNVLVFIVIYLLLVQVNYLLTPYYWGNKTYAEKINYLELNQNIDNSKIFYFGSSRIYRHLNPVIIDSVLNYNSVSRLKSFNLGTDGNFNPESFYLYEKFLESEVSKNTKVAILEVTDIKKNNWEDLLNERSYYYQNLSTYQYLIKSFYKDINESKKQRLFMSLKNTALFFVKLIKPPNYKKISQYNKCFPENINGFYSLEEELNETTDPVIFKDLSRRVNEISNDYKYLCRKREIASNSYLALDEGKGDLNLEVLKK